MKTDKDQVVFTLKLKRNKNGTVEISRAIEGSGFHIYEIIGLLQMTLIELAQDSKVSASKFPKDEVIVPVYEK